MTTQNYTVKEMLNIIAEDSKTERAETNKKIDKIHTDIKEFRSESNKTDKEQNERIGSLENFKSFAMGAVWLLTGSGAITGVYFLVAWMGK